MLKLIGKEIKMTITSISFLLSTILIIIMFLTQCLPEKWYYYAPPMDEMHLYYMVMNDDYKNGHTKKFASLEKKVLNEDMKEKLKETILLMNPNSSDDEVINQITFHISDEEYTAAMDALDKALLNGSYYLPRYHNDFYSVYCYHALGVKMVTNKEEMINCMESNIINTLEFGEYDEYSNLLGRRVELTGKESSYISDILEKMKLLRQKESDIDRLYEKYNAWYIDIDTMFGGNTLFGMKYRFYVYQIENSLSEAVYNFESIRDNEKITNAYARYYCDYFSLLAGFLPAVIGGFTLIEERRWKMHEMIYSRAIHSIEYVLAKYAAIVLSFMLCFYFLGAVSTFLFTQFSQQFHLGIDYFAFFKYITFWVMPTLLFTTAFAMFISVVFKNGVIPIMLQLFVFFLSANKLIGDYQIWKPIIRYNEIGDFAFYQNNLPNIILNRSLITIVSVLLVIGTAKRYSSIRKGCKSYRILREKKE